MENHPGAFEHRNGKDARCACAVVKSIQMWDIWASKDAWVTKMAFEQLGQSFQSHFFRGVRQESPANLKIWNLNVIAGFNLI